MQKKNPSANPAGSSSAYVCSSVTDLLAVRLLREGPTISKETLGMYIKPNHLFRGAMIFAFGM
jgi:hypothetical protein